MYITILEQEYILWGHLKFMVFIPHLSLILPGFVIITKISQRDTFHFVILSSD